MSSALHIAPSRSVFPFSPGTMFAPMEGVTSPVLRQEIAKLGGLGVVCTEFIRIASEVVRPEHLRTQVVKPTGLARSPALSVQLMGRGSDWMANAAGILDAAGADVVDINMGCPTRRAVKGGVGAAMLKDPALLEHVLGAMREKVTGLLSAKIRAGFDSPDQVTQIAKTVERAGADFLVVHPRCRVDQYKGIADWRIVKHLQRELTIPVIGNGDCWYAHDALRLTRLTGCQGIMIGRPVLRNPWIFRQIQELREGREAFHPKGEDVFLFFLAVAQGYQQEREDRRIIGRLKELSRYLLRSVYGGKELLRTALRTQSFSELMGVMEAGLLPLEAHQLDLASQSENPLERSAADSLALVV